MIKKITRTFNTALRLKLKIADKMNSSFTAADSNSSGHSVLKRDRQVSTASAGWSQLTPQLTTAWNTHTLSEQCAHMLNTAFVLWECHILWGSEPWGWKAEDRPRTLSSETQNTHYSLIITQQITRVALRWWWTPGRDWCTSSFAGSPEFYFLFCWFWRSAAGQEEPAPESCQT